MKARKKEKNRSKNFRVSVPANLKCSLMVRNILKNVLELVDIPFTWIFRLLIVVDELFMNAVKYGSNSIDDHVYITITIDSEKVMIDVEDVGKSTKRVSAIKLIKQIKTKKTKLTELSGRGLSLITNAWTDIVDITKSEYGGIKVHIEKIFNNCHVLPKDNSYIKQLHGGREYIFSLSEQLFEEYYAEELSKIFNAMDDNPTAKIIFDFERIRFLSHRNLGRIIEIYSRILERGGSVEFIGMQGQVDELLKQTFLNTIIK